MPPEKTCLQLRLSTERTTQAKGAQHDRHNSTPNFSDLRGHTDTVTKFSSEILNGRRVLLLGDLGTGAVAISRRTVGLLPVPTQTELDRINAVHEPIFHSTRTSRPFRAPHHTISVVGMLSEIQLARRGVIVLEDAPEFRKSALEIIGDAETNDTTLIATATKCACGKSQNCICTPQMRASWTKRLGNVISQLRIEAVIEVPTLSSDERTYGERCPSTEELTGAHK